MTDEELLGTLANYNFYHSIKLTDAISTKGHASFIPAQNLCADHLRRVDLNGKRVLDIGCRDGLFSFIAEAAGAREIVAIDNDISKAATEFLIPYFKSKVKMIEMNLYDLNEQQIGPFDVVIFPGVLYHLRYPFWALKVIRDVLRPGGHLLIETAIYRGSRNKAMLFCPTGQESPYEPTSCTFFNKKGLVDTLESLGFKTVAVEYVKRKVWRKVSAFVLRQGLAIDRCVFHFRYEGIDSNSNVMKYWEAVHNYHTGSK